jgi:general secretion pathway protein M
MTDTLDRYLARYPAAGVAAFVAVVLTLLVLTWSALADINDRRVALNTASDMLARLEGRSPKSAQEATSTGTIPAGSPFLEGQTVNIAGAALLQRVAGAVTKAGGNVLSSQVELQGAQAKDGYVNLIASCELEQAALQQLLYDLEAGMPFLFIDQLVAQMPTAGIEGGGRMRVLLSVSGLWPGK